MKKGVLAALLLGGCVHQSVPVAPTVPVRPAPVRIQKISVQPFEGEGGVAATNEFVRQLLGRGFQVVQRAAQADAVLSGVVTDYRSADKKLIFLGSVTMPAAGGQNVEVHNPVVSPEVSRSNGDGAAIAPRNTQIVAQNAFVGMRAHVTGTSGATVLWSGSSEYEGVDLPAALQAAVSRLEKSLRAAIPPPVLEGR